MKYLLIGIFFALTAQVSLAEDQGICCSTAGPAAEYGARYFFSNNWDDYSGQYTCPGSYTTPAKDITDRQTCENKNKKS